MSKEIVFGTPEKDALVFGEQDALPAQAPTPEPKYGLGETILEKGAKGASFGLLPALQVGAEFDIGGEASPMLGAATALAGRKQDEGWLDYLKRVAGNSSGITRTALSGLDRLTGGTGDQAVENARQQWMTRGNQMQKDRPVTSAVSEIGGALLNPLGGGPAKGLGQMALQGAKLGAMQGLGNGIGEGDSGLETGKKTLLGAGIGAAAAPVGYGLVKGLGALKNAPGALRNFAEERSVKALNPYLKDLKALVRGDGMDETAITDLGRTLLDKKMVRFGDKGQTVADRLSAEVDRTGGNIGDAIDAAEEAAQSLPKYWERTPVDLRNVTGKLGEEMRALPKARTDLSESFGNQINELSGIGERGIVDPSFNPMIGIKAGELEKRALQSKINYAVPTGEQTAANQALDSAAKGLRSEVERAIDVTGERAGRPDLLGNFLKAKQEYAPMQQALDIAQAGSLRNFRNRWISPTDYGTGLAGFVQTGSQGASPGASGLIGAALALGHKVARERGSASLAVGADKLANEFGHIGNTFAFAEPAAQAAGQAIQSAAPRLGALAQYFGAEDDPAAEQQYTPPQDQPIQPSDLQAAKDDFVRRGRVGGR